MMFLQFFIWGGWFVTLGTFLGSNLEATAGQSSMAFSTQSWGAIIAPFIIGLIADRYFNAERILGVLHLIGAFLMYQMYQSEDFVVPAIINKIKKKKLIFENVNHYRDFVSTNDICEAIKILSKNKSTGIYNIGSGKKILIANIIKKMIGKNNKKVSFKNNKKKLV